QAKGLLRGEALNPSLLGNAFTRALYDRVPSLAELPALIKASGAPNVALSGAGPAHYAVTNDAIHAHNIAANLRARLGGETRVFVANPVPPRAASGQQYDD